eukprot:Rhum_TRINITY_DN8318_c0_g1::Rhum_TRINITY_DN8318_c0_g1_i1::g.27286::m.27286/K01855/PUS3, DEG1; tRNA pseudouridine38/39 synthase
MDDALAAQLREEAAAAATGGGGGGGGGKKKGRKQREARAFDMSRYERRHVALRYCYMGQGYQGLALQDHTVETVEARLFEALRKVKLIGGDEKVPLGYSRCGRTDKGVSALGQVSAMMLRSSAPKAEGEQEQEQGEDGGERKARPEIDYVGVLNRVLPKDIRALAWAPVPVDFSARFTCSGRVYKYFFVKGAKDLDRMRAAAALLVGEHDFRNFAKLDVVNVSNFVRTIFSVTITPAAEGLSDSVHVITIAGTAFLYHQVRCMVAVLFEIGAGNEDPSLISALLDVVGQPSRPCYTMAPDLGLVLWDCLFPDVAWRTTTDAHKKLLAHFSAQFETALLTPMIQGHIHGHLMRHEDLLFLSADGTVENPGRDAAPFADALPEEAAAPAPAPAYVPILSRPTDMTYEDKVRGLGGSKKARHEANKLKGLEVRAAEGGSAAAATT